MIKYDQLQNILAVLSQEVRTLCRRALKAGQEERARAIFEAFFGKPTLQELAAQIRPMKGQFIANLEQRLALLRDRVSILHAVERDRKARGRHVLTRPVRSVTEQFFWARRLAKAEKETASLTELKPAEDFYCAHCGYNVKACRDDRCSECGEPFERYPLIPADLFANVFELLQKADGIVHRVRSS